MNLKNIRMKIVLFVVSFSVSLIYLMMTLPSIKENAIYVLGTTVSNKASDYLNNVKDDEVVIVDTEQFKVDNAGVYKIDVVYRDKIYKVPIVFNLPAIDDVIKVNGNTELFVGQSYDAIFDINPSYADKITYNISPDNLRIGEYDIVATVYQQTVSKKISVKSNDTIQGKLATAYTYKNTDLIAVVQQFLSDENIPENKISFSYLNVGNNSLIQFNKVDEKIAASTYKLPLNMLVTDLVNAGQLTVDDNVKIRNIGYDTQAEVNSFIKYNGAEVSVKNLQKLSITDSHNLASHMLFTLFGNQENAYRQMEKYGVAKGTIETIRRKDNATTSDFMIKVLKYLWDNQQNYQDIMVYLKNATPNQYYELYLKEVDILHKYGFYDTAINDLAIVYENKPYLIALYTDGITLDQFGKLAFVINEWHKANS